MWIASVLVFFFLLFTKNVDLQIRKEGWKSLLAGIVIAIHWITFFHAIKISTVSVALASMSTGAFFGSLIEPLASRRKVDKNEMLLGLLVILGLYLIFRFEGQYTIGIITALVSAFLSALFSVINAKLVKTNTPFKITFLELLGGWLTCTVFLIFTGGLNLELLALSNSDWGYLALLGSVCTAYAFIETVRLMRNISPFTFLLSINLEPIYGIIMALIFFGEGKELDPYFFVGAGIIISTVFVDIWLKKRKRVA